MNVRFHLFDSTFGGRRVWAGFMARGGLATIVDGLLETGFPHDRNKGKSIGMNILSVVNGYKTYIASAGLVGLALYQFSAGQYDQASQTFLAALAAAGLRNAIAKTSN